VVVVVVAPAFPITFLAVVVVVAEVGAYFYN